jgi:hypothetical protein
MRYKSHLSICLLLVVLFLPSLANAHPDEINTKGCHTCFENCYEWGESANVEHCHRGKQYQNLSEYKEIISEMDVVIREEMAKGNSTILCRENFFEGMIDGIRGWTLEISEKLKILREDSNIDYCHTTPGCEALLNDYEESMRFIEKRTDELVTTHINYCQSTPDVTFDMCTQSAESYEQQYCDSVVQKAQKKINDTRESIQEVISKYYASAFCRKNIFNKMIDEANRSIGILSRNKNNALEHDYVKYCQFTSECTEEGNVHDSAINLYAQWIEELAQYQATHCIDSTSYLSSYDYCVLEKHLLNSKIVCEDPPIMECDQYEMKESRVCLCQFRNDDGTCDSPKCFYGSSYANMCACIDGYVRNSDGICQLTTTPNESALLNSSTRQQRICERIRNREDIKGKFDVINRRLNKRYGFTCTLE